MHILNNVGYIFYHFSYSLTYLNLYQLFSVVWTCDDYMLICLLNYNFICCRNPLVPCHDTSALPVIDLSLWKDTNVPGIHDGELFYGKKK